MGHLVYVIGPPAVGKSTLLRELRRLGCATMPTATGENPHFAAAWSDPVAAFRSQEWFIVRHGEIARTAPSDDILFVEDDPIVSTSAHTEALVHGGLLDAEQAGTLARLAEATMREVEERPGQTTAALFLDAPDTVLAARMAARDGRFDGDREWLAVVARRMRATRDPAMEVLETDDAAPASIARHLHACARRHRPAL